MSTSAIVEMPSSESIKNTAAGNAAMAYNKQDVTLVQETVEFLERAAEHVSDLRSLMINLLDCQRRFSEPMDMEFGDRETDMPQAIELPPKNIPFLKKIGVLYSCPEKYRDLEDEEDFEIAADGAVYCYVGGDCFDALVKDKVLTGADAEPIKDSTWAWLPDLFEVFGAVGDTDPVARRLAACWYYTASEVDRLDDDDDDDDDTDTDTCTDEDEDDADDKGAPAFDEDDEDGGDAAAAATAEPVKKKAKTSAAAKSSGRGSSEELDLLAADDGDMESPESKKRRESILAVVDKLGAYLPSPASHKGFFSRMLKKSLTALAQSAEGKRWFPWGAPPLQHIVTALQKDGSDTERNRFLREILAAFVNQ